MPFEQDTQGTGSSIQSSWSEPRDQSRTPPPRDAVFRPYGGAWRSGHGGTGLKMGP